MRPQPHQGLARLDNSRRMGEPQPLLPLPNGETYPINGGDLILAFPLYSCDGFSLASHPAKPINYPITPHSAKCTGWAQAESLLPTPKPPRAEENVIFANQSKPETFLILASDDSARLTTVASSLKHLHLFEKYSSLHGAVLPKYRFELKPAKPHFAGHECLATLQEAQLEALNLSQTHPPNHQ